MLGIYPRYLYTVGNENLQKNEKSVLTARVVRWKFFLFKEIRSFKAKAQMTR